MAVTIRKLSQEEAAQHFPNSPGAPLPEYVEALRPLRPGDVAEAVRGNVSSRAFKRRLTLAAKHLGIALKYAPDSGDDVVRFQVKEPRRSSGEGQRRRGRPPKQAANG